MKVKASGGPVGEVPADVVAVTLTVPALPAGLVAVHVVCDEHVTAGEPSVPKLTVVPPDAVEKLVPVRVIASPPVVGPDAGLIAVMVGSEADGDTEEYTTPPLLSLPAAKQAVVVQAISTRVASTMPVPVSSCQVAPPSALLIGPLWLMAMQSAAV